MSASITTIVTRIAVLAALFTGTASGVARAAQDFVDDGNYGAEENRETGYPVSSAASRSASSDVAGIWEGGNQSQNYTLKARVALNPNGRYAATYVFQATVDGAAVDNTSELAGQWRVEGNILLMKDDSDGSVARLPFNLEGDSLSIADCGVNSEGLRLQRANPGPGVVPATDPVFPGGNRPAAPNSGSVNTPQPCVGTWYARGEKDGTNVKVRLILNADGSARTDIRVSAPGQMVQSLTDEGRWSLRQGQLTLDSNSGTSESVPCRLQNDQFFLDYSQLMGFVMVMERNPEGGTIQNSNGQPGGDQQIVASDW